MKGLIVFGMVAVGVIVVFAMLGMAMAIVAFKEASMFMD